MIIVLLPKSILNFHLQNLIQTEVCLLNNFEMICILVV